MSYKCAVQGTVFRIDKGLETELVEYNKTGIVYSEFLTAILTNNLKRAVELADPLNLINIPGYVAYIVNEQWGEFKQARLREEDK